jgi:hypothetical protein
MANWGANFVVTVSFLTLLERDRRRRHLLPVRRLSMVALAYFQAQGARDQEPQPAGDRTRPYYGLGVAGGGVGIGSVGRNSTPGTDTQVSSYEHVPAGEVQVRRGEHVHATDG